VLRYGVPPNFSAMTLRVTSANEKKLRTMVRRVFDGFVRVCMCGCLCVCVCVCVSVCQLVVIRR